MFPSGSQTRALGQLAHDSSQVRRAEGLRQAGVGDELPHDSVVVCYENACRQRA